MNNNTPKLTRRQAAIIGAFTGCTSGPFDDIKAYVESLPNMRGVGDIWMSQNFKQIQKAAEADFLAICANKEDEYDL
jgi:hypothetical protein